jgi:peptidoglycan hydrolase-like protein with peptidoglycan-binding domain
MKPSGRKKTKTIRNNKRRKISRKLYFGPETDSAITKFQSTNCLKEKTLIYQATIQPSFSKLAENLIFIHGFAKNHHSYETLKGDCVSFLYETLQKFDPARGSKAFSYFNVVAKNWLIIQSKKRVKNLSRHVSLSNFKDMKITDKEAIEMYNYMPAQDYRYIAGENKIILFEILGRIKKKINTQNEIACMNAIETLFNKIEELDFLNKRAIFVYMREISGLTPKQLSVAMSNIRKHYRDIKGTDLEYFSLFFVQE